MAAQTVIAPVASCSSSFAAQASQSGQTAGFASSPACITQARRQTFGDNKVLLSGTSKRQVRKGTFGVRAYQKYWPDPQFIQEVNEAFPDKGVATVDEARVLFTELGYTYVDVRPSVEVDEIGKVPGSINIPIKLGQKKYDAELKKKVLVKTDNPDFLKQIQKKFPDPETAKILVGCSNGRTYSMDALVALDEAGYVNIVGLQGGYYAWFKVFDNKLRRRMKGEYAEDYSHGADSAGIHASGAGFERTDKIEEWVPPDY
ncbi:unnamed protein product [Calypogeia fissa]